HRMASQQLRCCIIPPSPIVKFAIVFYFMRFPYLAQMRFAPLLVVAILLAMIHQDRSAIACTVGADLRVCPGSGLHAPVGADTQVCRYVVLETDLRAQTPMIRVITLDGSNRPAAAVRLELRRAGAVVGSAVTNEKGEAEFPLPAPGDYEIAAAKEEFETLIQSDLTVAAGAPLEVRFIMVPKIKIGEKIDVTASAASTTPLDQGASPSTDLQRQQVKDSALRATNVSDTLPLVPGIIRTDQGELKISGTSENRSAMLVNSADVTDPATGQFGMTVPVDVVNTISVFKTPYL